MITSLGAKRLQSSKKISIIKWSQTRLARNLGDLKIDQKMPCHCRGENEKKGEISCNKVECSIIKIEESYGPPAVKGSACEFDPIVVIHFFHWTCTAL